MTSRNDTTKPAATVAVVPSASDADPTGEKIATQLVRTRAALARWSRHFDACIDCGQTGRKHQARGLCSRCWQRRLKNGDLPPRRERSWSIYGAACKSCGRSDREHAGYGLCSYCYMNEYRSTPEGAEAVARYERTPERKAMRAARNAAEAQTERGKMWRHNAQLRYRANPENAAKYRWHARRYRGEAHGVVEEVTVAYEALVMDAFDRKCANCGTADTLVLDHHLPFSEGHGLLHNAIVLCNSCNASKRNQQPKDFYDPETLTRIESVLARIRATYPAPPSSRVES